MKWHFDGSPPKDSWCWVTDGDDVWPAQQYDHAAGGWSNMDCWEDFDHEVIAWWPIEKPDPPIDKLQNAA